MAEFSNAFKVKKGLDVVGDAALHGNALVDGYITTPTLASAENSTKVATTAFVQTAIANLVASAPGTLDTLNELATALGNDPNFATTMTNNLALKAPLASPALTGIPTAPTAAVADNSTTLATTAYVKSQLYATLASPALTGTPTAPTAAFGDNTTKISTTAFVQAAMAATGFGYDAGAIPGGTTASIDTNTIVSGLYVVTTSNTGTKPGGLTTGFLLVGREGAGTNAHQVYFDDKSARSFHRSYASSAWSAWREVAYLDSPTFTGTPAAPTAAVDTNTTQLATTGFVLGQAASVAPLMDAASAAVGTSTRFARQDHVHQTDSTRAPLASPALTGVPTAPTAAPGTNSTQLATTAYADAIAALKANIASPAFTGNATFANGMASADYTSFPFVNGGSLFNSNASAAVTGALKIKLPAAYLSTELAFDLDVVEGTTDSAFRLRISAFMFSSTSNWGTVTVNQVGGVASRLPNVRFGNDGTTACIWVGELTDNWTGPNVNISNLHVGYSNMNSNWSNAWALSYVTTFDTVKQGPITVNKAAFLNSPVFTGNPTTPTPGATDNSASIANTSWVNAAIAASGSTSIVTIPVTSTAMTLTAAQYSNSMIVFTGALTGNTTITVPNTAHAFIAANNTTASYTLTIKSSGQTPSVQVVQNKANSLYCDTTGVYATSSTTGVQFAKQVTLNANTTLDLSYLGSVVFVSTSGVTVTLPPANTYPAGAGFSIINFSSGNVSVASQGSDTFDAVASPLTLYPNDSYFLESNNGTNWHTVWYSNEKSPAFKTSISSPIALLGGTSNDGTNVLQVSGSARAANWYINSQTTTDSGLFGFGNSNGPAVVATGSGTATVGALLFKTGGTERARIMAGGNVLIGTTTDNGVDKLQVNGSIKSLTGGFTFPDGTNQVTANGVTAPTSTVYTPAANATSITTSGYNIPFVEVFKNNLRLIPTVDFTIPDGVNINLTTAATGRDRYEVLTKVIYSPSTVFQPTSQTFNVTAGQSTITVNYQVNCIWIFKNSQKLIPVTDFTATNGTSVTLTVASEYTTDVYEVVTFQPFTVNGMMPLAGGTFTGNYSVSTAAATNNTNLNANAGVAKTTTYQTAGVTRFVEGVSNDAETGSNAGSNWYLARSADNGSWIDNPLFVSRQTGLVTLSQGLILPDGYIQVVTPSGRNRIINGSANIAQRGSTAFATGASGYGGPDRFWAANNSTVGQFTQSVGTLVYNGVTRNAITQTVNTLSTAFTSNNYWSGVEQIIEQSQIYDMQGSPSTVSFLFGTNCPGTYSVCVQDFSQTKSFVQTFTAINGVTRVIIPVPAMPQFGLTNSNNGGLRIWIGFINQGTYLHTSPGSWISGNLLTTSSCVNWAATAGNYILVSELQYEPGSQATPFERVNIQALLNQCQRFYETGNQVYTITGTGYYQTYFKTPKRSTPTLTASASSGTLASYTASNDGIYFTYNFSSNVNITFTWTAYAEL